MSFSAKGYYSYSLEILDELDHQFAVADITSVTILTTETRNTAATVYTDKNGNTSVTNPVTAFTDGAHVKFWGAAATYDLIVKLSNGACKRFNAVSPSDGRLVVPRWFLTMVGIPTVNASATGVTQYAYPVGADRLQVELHLASTTVTLAAATTNGIAIGGIKLVDCADGVSMIEGRGADLSLAIADGMTQYFANATPEGLVGVGNKVKDDQADVGSSDSQDDNILGAADFTCAAYADTQILLNEAENILGDDQDIVLNASVAAADFVDDATSPTLAFSGVIDLDVTFKNAS